MARVPLFKTQQVFEFHSKLEDDAKYKVISELEKYFELSNNLNNKEYVYSLIDRALGSFLGLPNTSDGRKLYQIRVHVFSENDDQAGEEWFKYAGILINMIRRSLPWTRLSRALSQVIDGGDIKSACSKFKVSEFELKQFYSWYKERGSRIFGLKKFDKEWWESICDEEERFKAIYHEVVKHSSRKLANPNFRYLSDIYEDRSVLIQELVQKAWQAVVMTAHKPQVESLKLAKSYINSEVHKLASHYTNSQNKQVFNDESGVYEIQELQLLNNPEIDESKQVFLAYNDENYINFEIEHDLKNNLSDRQLKLVRVLSDAFVDPAFEIFATGKDRRKAAFQYFKVDESKLKESLHHLLRV